MSRARECSRRDISRASNEMLRRAFARAQRRVKGHACGVCVACGVWRVACAALACGVWRAPRAAWRVACLACAAWHVTRGWHVVRSACVRGVCVRACVCVRNVSYVCVSCVCVCVSCVCA